MEHMADAGPFEPRFNFSHFPEAPTELRYYVDELQTARIRHADWLPNTLAQYGLSGLEEKKELVADYINILSKLDMYEGSIFSPQKLAELCAINEQVTRFFDSHRFSWESADNQFVDVSLGDCLWVTDLAPKSLEEWDRLGNLRRIIPDVSTEKMRSINLSRYATRVWLDSFTDMDKPAAEYLVSSKFGQLFDIEMNDIEDFVSRARTPETAYARKITGIHRMSDHAFACFPMSADEAWELTDAIKTV